MNLWLICAKPWIHVASLAKTCPYPDPAFLHHHVDHFALSPQFWRKQQPFALLEKSITAQLIAINIYRWNPQVVNLKGNNSLFPLLEWSITTQLLVINIFLYMMPSILKENSRPNLHFLGQSITTQLPPININRRNW